ncbi:MULTISPECIES: ABC transporter permease [Aliiglaciecola]|uniref:ABC transporter permease n=1 Tax=Aliiglaciecola TaxID=1406885 RepID=UPI001C092D52|nr:MULTISPECIES: FtsX-like permease family protein [Aliiglaciecola]MBU2878299.1 FtsX-like permease family protein [Aliiglaciecola lipolytica]MDO6711789.1 FtsX-like permease family protein [Aliiglaciecola sp. 2_MG-2023]MDO6753037.1 FtsX-like permease family protein [Aliiglaciecola sp. 1_MG-2023]
MSSNQWEIGPIFRALMRNKVGAILIAIQIAVTMTIVVNSIFIILERAQRIERDSGIDEANSFYLTTTGFGTSFDPKSTAIDDLALIRATPGVLDAIQINAIPVSGGGWSMSFQTEPGEEKESEGAAIYMVDEHAINALDLEVIAGENFLPNDVRWRQRSVTDWPDNVLITKVLAESLFADIPYQNVVGKTIYIRQTEPMIVKGIVDKIQAPWVGWDDLEHTVLTPELTEFESNRYYIRALPGQRDAIMPIIEEALASSNKQRIIRNMRTVQETRERSYRGDTAMIKILSTTMVILTIVTGLGIVGLASFSVNRRKKQIGTRRALGASQGSIVRYFMIENFLISTVGVVLGAVLTVGLNMLLVNMFSLNALDWYFVPAGMLVLWIVGQIAVFGPAQKAANIPPALATRTV